MLERIISAAVAVFLLVGPGVVAAFAESGEPPVLRSEMTIRKTVQEVGLGFYVSKRNGQPVTGLQRSAFSLYQDGRPVSGFSGFYADQNLPLRVVLMIDASDSMGPGLAAERKAAASFLGHVLRPKIDQGTVVTFATRSEVEKNINSASPQALQKIEQLRTAGLTALFDSICDSAGLLPAGEHAATRRVLVLLSDGDDNYSRNSLGDAIRAALNSDLVIYAVAPHDARQSHWGDANLFALTEATGGRVFFLKKFQRPEKAFAQIEQEIRAQYIATFRPAGNTCGFHSVRIAPADHSLRVRTRAGFFGDCR